jgi:hypothetical protein
MKMTVKSTMKMMPKHRMITKYGYKHTKSSIAVCSARVPEKTSLKHK